MPHILIAPRPRHEAGYGRLDGDALTSRPSPSAKTNLTLLGAGSEILHPKPTLLPKHNPANLSVLPKSYTLTAFQPNCDRNHSNFNSDTLKPAIPPVGSFSPPRARSLLVFRSNNVKPASKLLSCPEFIRDQVYSPGNDGIKDKSYVLLLPQPTKHASTTVAVSAYPSPSHYQSLPRVLAMFTVSTLIPMAHLAFLTRRQSPRLLAMRRSSALSMVDSPHVNLKKTSSGVSQRRASAHDH